MNRDYTKKDEEQLDDLITRIQADSKHMTLLQVLSNQLEMFIIKGQTDIRSLFDSLVTEGLLSEDDRNTVVSQFPFAIVSLSTVKRAQSSNTAIGASSE